MIVLGPFRPDQADTNSGFLVTLANGTLKPDGNGVAYGPAPSLVVASTATALPAAPKGTLTAVTAGGAYKNFIMTSSAIYLLAADGSSSAIGTGYNLPAGDHWSSCQFGSKAIFSNTADGMLEYDIELGGAVTVISGAPKARVVRVVFDVLFALDCDGENKLMRNSDFNYSNWLTGVAGYQPMADGEELVGIAEVSDGVALVMQRNAIRVLIRVADASLYQMRLLAANQGAVNPQCIVSVNGALYYIDVNGVHRAAPDGVVEIGQNKVNNWLLNRFGSNGLSTIEGAYDPVREVVRWRYTDGSDDTIFTDSLDFDLRLGEFVPITEATTAIFTTATSGYTMEELDAFGTMDTIAISLDDRFWFGGVPQLGALDETYKLGYFSGGALAFTCDTSTMALDKRTKITSLRPVTDSPDISVAIGMSDRLSDALTFDDAVTPDEDGICSMYSAGKNLRFRAAIPAASVWTYVRGFDDLKPATGGRG